VLIFNSKGEVLIQKRSPNSPSLPNRWDQSAAGHVDEGEDYATAASRELKEEVGIDAPLKEKLKFYSEETDEPKVKKRFNVLYVGAYDGEVKIDNQEVSDVQWIMPDELESWMRRSPDEFTQGFIKCFQEFKKRKS